MLSLGVASDQEDSQQSALAPRLGQAVPEPWNTLWFLRTLTATAGPVSRSLGKVARPNNASQPGSSWQVGPRADPTSQPSSQAQGQWGPRHSQRSGGVIVMDWAVNSSSKYLVSTSEVT